jgi:signal transduction histidine kinase
MQISFLGLSFFIGNPTLAKVLALLCLFPIVSELLLYSLGNEVHWVNIPVHNVVEAWGFFAGFILAVLLILLRQYNNGYENHLWIASGLLVMGILDGFHAVIMPGNTFVWLRSIATLGGGIFFCMVWLPVQLTNRIRDRWIVGATSVGAVFLGAASLAWPSMVPVVLEEGNFSPIAITVNFIGGLGFLAAAVRFFLRQQQAHSIDNFYFGALSLMFGMAGVFFSLSKIWHMEWWFWHILRLLAYLVVMGQTFRLYKQNLDQIQVSLLRQEYQQHLEELVVERTAKLKASEAELRGSRDKLEEKVAERTADLQIANAALFADREHQATLIKKLDEAQNQLLQSEKMASIGQLAAGVAHEINNPVGFINSNVRTLERYLNDLLLIIAAYEQAESLTVPLSKECAEVKSLKEKLDYAYLKEDVVCLIKETLEGIARVSKIVQDLKDFSHIDESEWQLADLHKGLDSTLNLVNNEIKHKTEVAKEYGPLPEVECLPFQLNQVFMNLLVNAADSITERGTITLRTGREGDEVWVEIADTGYGIAPENIKRIFEPFFTTKPIGKGTGLGLSLSYSIVKKHHGTIKVDSEQGKGTKFRITLPVQQPQV